MSEPAHLSKPTSHAHPTICARASSSPELDPADGGRTSRLAGISAATLGLGLIVLAGWLLCQSPATGLAQTSADWPQIGFITVTTGLNLPVHVTPAGDGSGRLFVVEQRGVIRIVKGGALQPTPFLDIQSKVVCCGEQGLLSLAFPPGFAAKRYFYVYYTGKPSGDTVVARYRLSTNPDVADATSEQVVLGYPQPYANHNGGQLAFGPNDGYLYIGLGDGGSGNDPQNRAQNPAELLGKILRIDVEAGSPVTYTIPASNPFTRTAGTRPEIWALGLRNPWRFSFDRQTADLYIADVGQAQREEVDFQLAASGGGEDYGWRVYEGTLCTNLDPLLCQPGNYTAPVLDYDHSLGCSITGGFVYRSPTYARLRGDYLYGDYCSGRIWGLRQAAGEWQSQLLRDTALNISTFGEDEAGRLYVAQHADSGAGAIYEIADTTFADVPASHWSWEQVEQLAASGVTTGCSQAPLLYCPASAVSRDQMAVFLVRATHGRDFVPPAPSGLFADVPASAWAAAHIEQLFRDGITTGCVSGSSSATRRYCPTQAVTREEMAAFLVRARHGAGFTAPPPTGNVFADVPASNWAAAWIEQAYADGITTGCQPGASASTRRYCPGGTVTRAEMAPFLVRTYNLPLP